MRDHVHIAAIAAPSIDQFSHTYVSQTAIATWLRACASESTDTPAQTCLALADAVDSWTSVRKVER